MIIADTLIDMNVADGDGTTLTTAILGNGTQGVSGGWSISGTASSLKAAALTGTATAGITEQDIINGGKTLVLTLTGDTFIT